jgi:hypothetical protein
VKRRDLPYQSGKSKLWLKFKNPNSPAMTRLDRDEKLSMRPSDARLSFTVESDGPICFPPSEAVSRSDDRAADCWPGACRREGEGSFVMPRFVAIFGSSLSSDGHGRDRLSCLG